MINTLLLITVIFCYTLFSVEPCFFLVLDNTNIKTSTCEPQSYQALETFLFNIFCQKASMFKSLHFTFFLCNCSRGSGYPEDNAHTL